MQADTVDIMLKNYRQYVGRCGHLLSEIEVKTRQLRRMRANMVDDAAAIGAQCMTGMPHGGAISNPTERLATMFADGYVSDDIRDVQAEIDALQAEYDEKYATVAFVDAWLQGLNDKERWIVEQQVIDGAYWREIIARCKAMFGSEYTKDGMKRIKARALEKIYAMAQ